MKLSRLSPATSAARAAIVREAPARRWGQALDSVALHPVAGPIILAGHSQGALHLTHLLKDRVAHVRHFLDAVADVAAGQTIIDPEVVRALVGGAAASGPIALLTPREREVLSLMAEGRTNHAIAEALVVSEAAVRKHIGGIFSKLPLDDGADRRVSAVLAYLRSEGR